MNIESIPSREPLSFPAEADFSPTPPRDEVEDAYRLSDRSGSAGADDDGHGHPANDDPEL